MTTSTGNSDPNWRVAVAYWRDGGHYPRAGASVQGEDVYLEATTVMAASLHRFAPGVKVELFTNVGSDAEPGAALERAGVTLRSTPFEHQPPPGYFHKFSGSLYSLDVIAALEAEADDDEVVLLVDPDVVWLRSPAPIINHAVRSGFVGYPIPYPADFRDLGFTRQELSDLVVELTGSPADDLVRHLGGELIASTGRELRRFGPASRQYWQRSVERFHDGQPPWLHTEEHVFSAAFHALGYGEKQTTSEIRRVWTRPGHLRNVRADDLERTAWHALAEKGRGLGSLYEAFVDGAAPFSPGVGDDEYRVLVAQLLGVHSTPIDRMRFQRDKVKARIRKRRIGPMPA